MPVMADCRQTAGPGGMMNAEYRRDPDRILDEITREERRNRRGRLKIFLGYASGVGKSARMLEEGRRRRERGEDVVAAAVQPYSTSEIDELLAGYEVIPTVNHAGRDVLDMERILRRRPQVALIDGLAYDNPRGSQYQHRWQQIDELL